MVKNLAANENVSIDIDGGRVILDATVTAGTFRIGGVGELIDNSTGATVYHDSLLHTQDVHDIHDAHFNRRKWDKTGNTVTIYDEDGVTPLHVFDTNSDLSELTPQ